MNQFNEAVAAHDLEKIISLEIHNVEEVFFVIDALLKLRNIKQAKNILSTYQSFLKEKGVYESLAHKIYYDLGEDRLDDLIESIRNQKNYLINNRVYGIYNFSLGYYYLREKNFKLAKKFHKEAESAFTKENLPSWSWRSRFNIFLSNCYLENFSNFEEKFILIEQEFYSLPPKAQLYFSQFIIWLLLYRNRIQDAVDLCSRYIKNDKDDGLKLNDYLFYIKEVHETKVQQSPLRRKSSFIQLVEHISNNFLSLKEFKKLTENTVVIDRFMLAHVYLHTNLKNKRYFHILALYDCLIELLRIEEIYVIPPFHLLEYKLIASIQTKNDESKSETLHEIKRTCPQWIYEKSIKKVQEIESKINGKNIYYKVDQDILCYEHTSLDIKNMKKIKDLLLILCSGNRKYYLNKISQEIYSDSKRDQSIDNTKALCFRLKKSLSLEYYSIENDVLIIHPPYKFHKVIKRGRKTEFHPEMIIDVMKESHTESFTSKRLKEILKVSSRTITNNLHILLNDKRIIKRGQGRSSRYELLKENASNI